MLNKIYYERIINIANGIVLCLIIGIFNLYVKQEFSIFKLIEIFISSFFVSYTLGDLVPVKKIADYVIQILFINKRSLLGKVVFTFIISLFLVTLISFFNTIIALGLKNNLFITWWEEYPLTFLVGFIVLFFWLRISEKLADVLTIEKNE